MEFMKDREIRRFCYYLTAVLAAASVMGFVVWGVCGRLIEGAILAHDRAVAYALLEQGVSREVTARAFAQKNRTTAGEDLLGQIGISEETDILLLPDFVPVQKKALPLLAGLFLFLWGGILLGTGMFFSGRERIYKKAVSVVERFMEGDFGEHLPRAKEGSLYELFGKIDSLAKMLSAQKEEVCASKNFLKDTISDISHQLKTPLSALVMYNDIIAGEAQDAEAVIGFSQKTSAALRRIERLVQSLLKITRLDAGAVAFEKQDWLLADVASKAVEELWVRAKAEGKRITLAGAEEVKINCDLSWTVEALSNLVKNALDYTPEGGEIEVAWERMAEMVRISVSDNGKGIAEEDYYHIFKRFYRSKGVQGDSQGIGLGLSLAKSIVEGQKGTLSVESGADAGSVFTMTFPG